jgi:isoamylase
MPENDLQYSPGFPSRLPNGATLDGDGIHFSVFSRHATRVWLVLFSSECDDAPFSEIELDPDRNRTGDLWHVWVKGLGEGQLYLWRMDGPNDPSGGHRFNPEALLLDPCAKALTGSFDWDRATRLPGGGDYAVCFGCEAAGCIPKCVVVSDRFDWQGDRPLSRPLSETVIYECHLRGLTAHESSGAKQPGTYSGVLEKIPYFKELGVTALEFLPVQEFSVLHENRIHPDTGERLDNYWGYNTVSFFAPNGRYSSQGTHGGQVAEFKTMVRELHKAGIEVILDVVFNHTAEGSAEGPTLCFRGIDNKVYYLLDPKTGKYLDYTGCGNTVNCNHPVVRDFIISCLHYWVLHMHVDGFRFDLASVLGRDESGELIPNPPLLERIEEDPLLRGTKIIAEAWDAAGAYQVGEFSGRWAEWNGKFRDDVRRFWRGEKATMGDFATRLSGSSDLYGDDGRTPHHSINFVTSHDGFTLADWTSYEKKHNQANGMRNVDGDESNLSNNHGAEGPSDDPKVVEVRNRQAKNLYATLVLSLGVPMILAGDEFSRTQNGNNNAYCQDNETSWIDWELVRTNGEMFRFAREVLAFRVRHPSLRRRGFFTGGKVVGNQSLDLDWLDANGSEPDWEKGPSCLLALINGHWGEGDEHRDCDILIIANADTQAATVGIPDAPNGGPWRLAIDTQNESPNDIYAEGEAPLLGRPTFAIRDRSLAVLIATCQEGTVHEG